MSIDRILLLKLVADVGDVNAKMSGAVEDVGKVRGALQGLKNWGVAVGANLGMDLIGSLSRELGEAVTAAGDLRRELDNLGVLTTAIDIDTSTAETALEGLTREAATMGFGDPEETARQFRTALAVTEDIDTATQLVQAGWDLARAKGEDARESFEDAMDAIVGGGDEAEEKLGVFGETFDERMAAFQAKYGNFSETFALTDEGQWEAINAKFDGHMTDLGGIVDQWIIDVKGALVGMFEDWEFIFEEGPRIVGLAMDAVHEKWTEGLNGLRNAFYGLINSIIAAWNSLDFSIDFDFQIPGTPFSDPINLGVHTGDLIPDLGYVGLARGGIVTGPTLALLGEGSHDEAVVPLDGRAMGGVTVNVYASAASPADVGREVVDAIEAYERRAGAGWRGA
jgi:hypothetical protein